MFLMVECGIAPAYSRDVILISWLKLLVVLAHWKRPVFVIIGVFVAIWWCVCSVSVVASAQYWLFGIVGYEGVCWDGLS